MNYFVVISSDIFKSLKNRPQNEVSCITFRDVQVQVRTISLSNWVIFVYDEPNKPCDLSYYLTDIVEKIRNQQLTQLWVFFHISILPQYSEYPHQQRYGQYEEILQEELNQPDDRIKVWGFHRVLGVGVWDTLKDLPQWLSGNFDHFVDKVRIALDSKLVKSLTILKHDFAFLFLPIDIDAQGLIEVGNRAQYWNGENPYTGEMLKNLWERARELANNVKQVVNEVKERASDTEKEKICQAWNKMASPLPNTDNPPERVTQIFRDLKQTELVDLEKLRCHWTQFHNWLVDLCEAMDELRDVVEKVEGRR
jgi:hypothetical protein